MSYRDRKPVKIAVAGMYRQVWAGDKAGQLERSLLEMEALAARWGFDFYPCREPLLAWQDAENLRRELEANQVDFLLLQTSSFGSGDVLMPLLDGRYRLGLWSVPEPASEGRLPLNSLCGANHLISIVLQYDKKNERGVKWFHGQVSDELFQSRLRVTVEALRGIKALHGARIGLLGSYATGFQNTLFDRRVLEARYGVRFYDHELAEIFARMRQVSEKAKQTVAEEMARAASKVRVEQNALVKAGALETAVRELAEEKGYSALAVRCWPEWQGDFGIAPCSTLGRLNGLGIPTACEGDALGALGMLILNGIAGQPATLMDLIAYDTQDESLQLWHCGPSAIEAFADEQGAELVNQFNQGVPASNDLVFRKGAGTVLQVVEDGRHLFLVEGESMGRQKPGFNGSRGWFGNLTMNGKPTPVMDIIHTVMSRGITHHYALAMGSWTEAVLEMASWLGLEPIPPTAYTHRKPLASEIG